MTKNIAQAIKETAEIIDSWLPLKIQYDKIPGLSVGIVCEGKLLYKADFGFADLEKKKKAVPETCYRIASISKTFTSVSILQLAEQNKLKLDDRVEKYLPWFKVKNKKMNSSAITIRQLLSHTAGVFRDGDTPHWEDDKFPDIKKLKKSISEKTLVFKPQKHFKYSNFGYAILGQVIEIVSGLTYNEYVKKNIISKLHMAKTEPDLTQDSIKNLAKGYSRPIPGKERMVFKNSETKAYAPATGFLSNVDDLAKYVSVFTRSSMSPLLTLKSKREIVRDSRKTGEENQKYGLGFYCSEIKKRKVIGHGGGYCGFITQIIMDDKIGVIVLSNTNESSAPQICEGILETIYTIIDEKKKYFTGKGFDESRYEGVYRSRWNDLIIKRLGNSLIEINPASNSPLKRSAILRYRGNNEFLIDSGSWFASPGELVNFIIKEKNKKANKLIWGAIPAKRVNFF